MIPPVVNVPGYRLDAVEPVACPRCGHVGRPDVARGATGNRPSIRCRECYGWRAAPVDLAVAITPRIEAS